MYCKQCFSRFSLILGAVPALFILAFWGLANAQTIAAGGLNTDVRTVLVVWEEWARLCDEQVGWTLTPMLSVITRRLDALDSKHFPVSP